MGEDLRRGNVRNLDESDGLVQVGSRFPDPYSGALATATMKSTQHPSTLRRAAAYLLPLAIAGFAGVQLTSDGLEPKALAANTGGGQVVMDGDLDGIPDRQEVVIGTDPTLPDTDFDGYLDGEELALQSNPLQYAETPEDSHLSMGMSARGEPGKVKLFTAVLIGDGNLSNKIIRYGALINGQVESLPLERLLPYTQSNQVVLADGSLLYTLDISIPEEFINSVGSMTVFGAVGIVGEDRYASSAKVDLHLVESVLMWSRPVAGKMAGPVPFGDVGSINQPIPPSGDVVIPLEWEPGKICYQLSEVVGTAGSQIVNRVYYANCEQGWNTYCPSDCPATVGTTFVTVDPGALLGG